MTTIPQLS